MIPLAQLKRSPFAFPLACLAALALVFISETSYWQSSGTLDALGRMGTARLNIQSVLRYIVDAETGQRGYLLTGRKQYLQPYQEAREALGVSLDSLQAYYADEAPLLEVVRKIRELTQRKLSELDTTIKLRDEGKAEAATEIVQTDIGREWMQGIRTLSEQLLAVETIKVATGRQDVYRTLMLNRIGVAAMSAISLLALYMYLRQTAALEAQRKEQQNIVRAERDRLEIEVRNRTAQLTDLAQHLQTAREDERSRLARDLHDELGALLTAAKLDAARLKSRLGTMTPEAAERLTHLNETLNSGIALKRRIIEDLRPSSLSNLGLVSALSIQSREFADRSGLPVDTAFDETVRLTPSGDLTVYRLVQEAFTNIAKYAQARHIRVELARVDDWVQVSVHDDGIGFDTEAERSSAHGLLGMRYRVEAEGGVMSLQSTPGHGTHIRATLPQVPQVAELPQARQPA